MCCRAVWESLEVVRQESLSNEFRLYDGLGAGNVDRRICR